MDILKDINIKKYLKKNAPLLTLTLLFSAIATVCSLLGPYYVGKAVSAIPTYTNLFKLFYKYILALLATYCVGTIFTYIFTICAYRAAQSLTIQLRRQVLDKVYQVPIKEIDNTPFGHIISLMLNDIENVGEGLFQLVTTLFPGIITIFGTIGIMLSLNWKIGLVIIAITPMSIFLTYFVTKKSKKFFKAQQSNIAKLNTLATEYYTNQKLIIAYNYQDKTEEKFEEINSKLFDSYKKSMFISAIPNPASRVVNYTVYGISGMMGVLMKIAVGDITSLLLYCNHFNKPFTEITSVTTQLQSATSSFRRIKEFLNRPNMVERENLLNLKEAKGNFEFNNVSFSYSDKPFLENLNLTVEQGKRIAIVGPTGSGKTTLINLIMRFYEINNGEILLDGNDIRNFTKESLRNQIGMVLQDSFLFKGTIADNIAYGQEGISLDNIMEAAQKAYCHDFIEKLPNGYQTIIENNGDIFSQGQKQLLCIARIMLKLPPILILDEATSNIDTRTEKLIQAAFSEMMKSRTTFVIAHRLSTIKDADSILVIVSGNVVEQGSHNELMAKNGFYTKLYNSQYNVI